jgi:pentatricopeptide repeat protein
LSFNLYIEVCERAIKLREAKELFEKMRQMSLSLDKSTYNMMRRCYDQSRDMDKDIMILFYMMETDVGKLGK